jgi:hypothetical protein
MESTHGSGCRWNRASLPSEENSQAYTEYEDVIYFRVIGWIGHVVVGVEMESSDFSMRLMSAPG